MKGGSSMAEAAGSSNIAERAIEAVQSAPSFDLSKIMALSTDGVAEAAAELGNWPSDYAVRLLEFLHLTTDLPYWAVIVGTTVALRVVLFPLVATSARHSARFQLAKPEVDALQKSLEGASPSDRVSIKKFQDQYKGLMAKYQVKQSMVLCGPLSNAMLFIPMFFGLRKMGEYVPDFAQGGAQWFVDLGMADPTNALPIIVTASFIAVAEVGLDGVKLQTSPQMKLFFRAMPVIMLPLFTIDMPAGTLLYWFTSNACSIVQTLAMRNKALKRRLGIPEIPERLQAKPGENPFKKLLEQYEKNKQAKAMAESEILHGKRPPPPPSSAHQPVVTFTQPPSKRPPAKDAKSGVAE